MPEEITVLPAPGPHVRTIRFIDTYLSRALGVLAFWRFNDVVPSIIDYPNVLETLRAAKLRCVYHNSGAFAFEDGISTQSLGWIGPVDESIRPEVRHLIRKVPPPFEENLSRLLVRAWREILPGKIWVMPASHWTYELDFGSRAWMPEILQSIGIESRLLKTRTTAAAIEFFEDETQMLERFVARLLEMLQASDFSIAFPGRAAICSLHHHKQLWWTSSDERIVAALETLI
jgi:hypothetical protein